MLVGLDSLPKSILYYRQQIQWLGGMGIVILAVALVPVLGVGGMSLYKAETPGPIKDEKLTPRIADRKGAVADLRQFDRGVRREPLARRHEPDSIVSYRP